MITSRDGIDQICMVQRNFNTESLVTTRPQGLLQHFIWEMEGMHQQFALLFESMQHVSSAVKTGDQKWVTGHRDKAGSVAQYGGDWEGKLSGNGHGDQTRTQCDKVTM